MSVLYLSKYFTKRHRDVWCIPCFFYHMIRQVTCCCILSLNVVTFGANELLQVVITVSLLVKAFTYHVSTTATKYGMILYLYPILGTFGAGELLSEESDSSQCAGGYYSESVG